MVGVRQRFDAVALEDPAATTRQELTRVGLAGAVAPGARIAVAAGSRGIANLAAITRAVVDAVRQAGGRPFLFPAMGSHGGATAEGQRQVLASYGLTEESMGAPVESTMEVVELSRLADGTPVLVNRLAAGADGIILINRVKPHTSFRGPFESGLMKMMTIGLGSHRGATYAHAQGAQGLARIIPAVGRAVIERLPVLLGLAIIETAYEQTGRIVALRAQEIEPREPELLEEARAAMPRLLVDGIDLLIVDEMGKDISGTGMDTNVIGRMMLPGVPEPEHPGVSRIMVRALSERTHGNANGVGLADVVTRRLYNQIDFKATYANAFTSTFLNRAYIPVVMETDQEAVEAMLAVLHLEDPTAARVARIRSTLEVERIQLSEPLAQQYAGHPDLERLGEPAPMAFDGEGTLQ
ncbi:MAG: lactate racemase domain-containing protein [Gemmatimonadota bacterium]